MNNLHKYQEHIFDIIIFISYILVIVSSLGLSTEAPYYLTNIDYYIRIYICLFLIWRFNPLRSNYEFTDLDRKIAFSAGVFILTTTALNQNLNNAKGFLKNKIHTLNGDFF
jgi:purine-cytosine permease-like protein